MWGARLPDATRPDRGQAHGRSGQEDALLLLAALSLAAGALALLVTRASILEWARAALPERVQPAARCTFCASFWFACVLTSIYGPLETAGGSLLLSVLAVWGGAATVAGLAGMDPYGA